MTKTLTERAADWRDEGKRTLEDATKRLAEPGGFADPEAMATRAASIAHQQGYATGLLRAAHAAEHRNQISDVRDAIEDMLIQGADDSWSGRIRNAVNRSTFDGTREAARKIRWQLDRITEEAAE